MANVSVLAPFILSWEGGYSDHPKDKGGATNMGVTLSTLRAVGYDKNGDGKTDEIDLKQLTSRDVTEAFLKPYFWDKCKADKIKSQSVANILVDWAWASGGNAVKGMQKLLKVQADGIVGEQTLSAINNAGNARLLFASIKRARAAFLKKIVEKHPEQEVFLKGWLRRLNAINYESLTLNKAGKNNVITFSDV